MWAILFFAICLGFKSALSQRDIVSTDIDFKPQHPIYWKIIGGEEAEYGEFPFMLALEFDGSLMCGASAIGDYWALTAAHCIFGDYPESYAVRAGSLDREKGGTVHRAQKLIVHHYYGIDESFDNDIALVKVKDALTNNKYVRLVPLPSSSNLQLPTGTVLTVSGWGATRSIFEPGRTETLRKTNVVVLSKKTCEDDPTLSGQMVITDNMICAQEKGHTAYKGDSGGPLFLRNKNGVTQVGVVSWGDFTGEQKHPTVFTKVARYRLWIHMKSGI